MKRPSAPHEARRVPWRGLLAACAALIVYGSLYPFEAAAPPSAVAAWQAFLADHRLWTNRGDVVGNVVLFVPLGALGVFAWPARARRPGALAALALAATAFAFVVQVAQIWFPPRTAALADIWWNAAGTAVGMALALALLRRASAVAWQPGRTAAWVLLALWLATHWLPLVPTLDWQAVKDGLKPLLLHPRIGAPEVLLVAARVLAAGCLFSAARSAPRGGALGFALLLALVIAVRPFIVGRVVHASLVAGFVAGYAAWLALAPRPEQRLLAAFGLLFGAYTVNALAPFEWRAFPSPMHLMPFQALLQGSLEINLRALFDMLYVHAALLWLVQRQGGRVLGWSVALAAWVALAEWAQTWIVGRTADLTEPLIVLAIGIVMQRVSGAPGGHASFAYGRTWENRGLSQTVPPRHDDHDPIRRPR